MELLNNQRKLFIAFIAVSIPLISYLHYSTNTDFHELHNVFAELYYIPILIGALIFGLKGALITYLFISLLYIPHLLLNWSGSFSFAANKLSHALISGAVVIIAGFLVDREKKRREQLEKDHYLASLGRASAAIVHDLKNPLISILGFTRRIREGKGDTETALDAISDSTESMQMIMRDVLDFAKPVRVDLSEKDIGAIVRSACESCRTEAEKKEVDINIDIPDNPIVIAADEVKILRALINLIHNAIDASPISSVVSVSVESVKEHIVVKISDSGSGMDKGTLENIFIPFYTKKSSGTGLGMAVAKKIIEGHKGEIHIDSKLQIGTEVIIELPN
ncbi:MAG TPA: HAMP domain-containing histidine kinase [bacterium]|nr:HAMP domain-containing histidine kinase [bacterium]